MATGAYFCDVSNSTTNDVTGDVIRHTRIVLIRQVTARRFSCGMSIDYFSDSGKQ